MGRKPKAEEERIVNRIEQLRNKANLSRQDLADRVGVHYQTIGYIERGDYAPSLVLALRIAAIFTTTVEDVFWLEEENNE